jgi:hypothetical protein
MQCSQLLYAQKAGETNKWTQADINDPLNFDRVTEFEIKVGDLRLTSKSYKEWSIDNAKNQMKRNMAAAFLKDGIPEMSQTRLIMQMACPDLNDAMSMTLSLDDVYLANKLSNLIPYVIKMAELLATLEEETLKS